MNGSGAPDPESHRRASLAEAEIKQLLDGLETRTVIGQAEGILMERLGVDADQAIAYLKRASSHRNRKLVDIAAEIASTRELPPLD